MKGPGRRGGKGGREAHLGCLPCPASVLAILFDQGEDACGDDAVGLAEVLVDFWKREAARQSGHARSTDASKRGRAAGGAHLAGSG